MLASSRLGAFFVLVTTVFIMGFVMYGVFFVFGLYNSNIVPNPCHSCIPFDRNGGCPFIPNDYTVQKAMKLYYTCCDRLYHQTAAGQ